MVVVKNPLPSLRASNIVFLVILWKPTRLVIIIETLLWFRGDTRCTLEPEIFSLTNEREGEEGKRSRSASSRSSFAFGFVSIFARVRLRFDLRFRSAPSRSSLVFVSELPVPECTRCVLYIKILILGVYKSVYLQVKTEGETKERQRFPDLTRTTCARDSISRVSRMTRAVERALIVGAVGVRVTVVGEILVLVGQRVGKTFICICSGSLKYFKRIALPFG